MTISMLAHSALGENSQAILHNIARLNRATIDKPVAKIMVFSKNDQPTEAVLSDLHTIGAPMYSTPVHGNWLRRIHAFAAKRGIQVIDSIYIHNQIEVTA